MIVSKTYFMELLIIYANFISILKLKTMEVIAKIRYNDSGT